MRYGTIGSNPMWKLALRNVFRHKARTQLTLAAIASGVAALILSGGFIQDFFFQLREATIHSQFGHLQVYKNGYYNFGIRAPYKYMINEPDALIARLRGIEHVSDITPRINFSGLLSTGRTTFPIIGEGVDPGKDIKISNYLIITSGTNLPKDAPYTMIIGQGVANSLNLKIGDTATILLNTRGGALNSLDFTIAGIFQTYSKEYDDRAVRISLTAAQELLATNAVHSLVFSLDDTMHTDSVTSAVQSSLIGGQFETKTWYQLADFYQKAVDLYDRYFMVLRLVILGMVLLGVANSVNMTIYERTGEFGTLKALGDRSGKLFKLIMLENLILGTLGAVTGVTIAYFAAIVVSTVGIPMPPMPNTNVGYTAHIRIVISDVGLAFVIGIAATVLAAAWPARKASCIPVIDALARN